MKKIVSSRCNGKTESEFRKMMKTEMTPLEALENLRMLFMGSPIDLSHHLNIIETALKVLEIIKNKRVNIEDFLDYIEHDNPSYEEYAYEWFGEYEYFPENQLTEEEYDLLKEVLK